MDEIVFLSLRELAARIREREMSVIEVVAAHLAQAERYNPEVNAIVTLDRKGALRRAGEADEALARGEIWGPLHGVPFTIKDTLETAGVRTTSGYPALAEYIPTTDATVVGRLRQAGGILLGKTNLPTLAMGAHTDNLLFGRTNNPWDLARTPGGSTGGGAAAVATGMSPLEIGSDAAGSVRIPAHFCGVYALKPTDYRVPLTGHIPPLPPLSPQQMFRHGPVIGPIARSVEDLALALRVIAGADDRYWAVPPVPLEHPCELTWQAMRIAWTDDFGGLPTTDDTQVTLNGLAEELVRRGCVVERSTIEGFDFVKAWETHGELWQAETGSLLPAEMEASQAAGLSADGQDPFLRGMARRVNATMRQYTATLCQRDTLIGALERFFARWDALLCPVVGTPALPHAAIGTPIRINDHIVPYSTGMMAYCSPFSLTGHPCVVIPVALSEEGLPVGLQLVGRRWKEMELLGMAARISEVIGRFPRPPLLSRPVS